MNWDPQKLFIGLMDFFSILLPGALLTYLTMDQVAPVVISNRSPEGAEGWAVFFLASYLFGHLLFLLASWLDEFTYDWIRRRYTLNKQIFRVAHGGKLLPGVARALIWAVFKQERDLAVNRAQRIKTEMLKCLGAADSVNTFQWAKVYLAKEHSEGLAVVQRFEADSKFFRSLVVALVVLVIMWLLQAEWRLAGAGSAVLPFSGAAEGAC